MHESSERPVPVVAALICKSGRVLVCQRRFSDTFPGKWEFPGGKVEPGESASEAVARELLEELGIHAEIGELVGEMDYQYPGRSPIHLMFFAVAKFDGVPENRVFQQIRWVLPGELENFDFLEADRPLLRKIAAGEISLL